jgi:two-component system, NarL family, sensor histidine kinase UhpB
MTPRGNREDTLVKSGAGVGRSPLGGRFGGILLALAWITVSLVAAWALVQAEFQEAKDELEREAQRLHAMLRDQAILNDAAIEGMAAALRICPRGDPEPSRGYARAILERYPHIYVLGAALRLEHPLRDNFEATLLAHGVSGGVRGFDYEGDRQWRPVSQKALYYPIQMAEPELESTWAVLGLDLDAVPLFQDTLQRALASDRPAVSGVFEMTIGRRAFGLLRPVCDATEGPCDGRDALTTPRHIALLVVFAESMVDCASAAREGYSCAVRIEQDGAPPERTVLAADRAADTATALERWVFPRVEYRMAVTNASQPLVLELSRQFDRHSIDLRGPVLLLLLSGIGLLVAQRLRRNHERSENARAAIYQALNKERASLEIRVQERTEQLTEINEELARENRAREAAETALRHKGSQLRLLARRLMDAQEQERRALAQELHDDMGQTLTALRTHAQIIRQQHAADTDACVLSARTILDLAGRLYDSTHRIMRRLRPRALDELGLAGALTSSIESAGLEMMGIDVHTELCDDLEGVEDAVAVAVYRLLQEALTNVARHSGARNVWIRLSLETRPEGEAAGGEILGLSVEDDGRGMPEAMLDKDRLGLLGAQERVEALGGRFSVEARAGGGVRLCAEIPLNQE